MTGIEGEGHTPPSSVARHRLRQLRDRLGLTVDDVVERCRRLGATDVTDNIIWNIESGRRKLSLDVTVTLAAALGVPFMSLLVPDDPDATIHATPAVPVSPNRFAAWSTGTAPLPGADAGAFAEAAADLPLPGREPEDVDWQSRVRWAITHIDDHAETAAQKLNQSARDFLTAFEVVATESPSAKDALSLLQRRLGSTPDASKDDP
ncbi:helix-turn-helix domain-containing protein [Stackebrandtia nassauensis]|uniref:Transcriptional regulator, XRE family n=1 Tax=Stackebrandtia nassauensis (strain DSM 44728 / CIP 108903 / NRRL B-16338 / NBRC 102104 / LLR-40K-21) TaxID=446470 RepID=D3PVT3_STANL|nr:helix-turn-helix transcriptional regulator [Stackebrandtia nassauensis]ADD45054.1 transcriptional regulator, XRE family [Stackebrandtia nassauensis DSM 44728]